MVRGSDGARTGRAFPKGTDAATAVAAVGDASGRAMAKGPDDRDEAVVQFRNAVRDPREG